MDTSASGYLQWSSLVHTLVIHSDFTNIGWDGILRTLLTVTQRRKAAGFPFRTVSLFLLEDPELKRVLEELEESIERFEVTVPKMFGSGMRTSISWTGSNTFRKVEV